MPFALNTGIFSHPDILQERGGRAAALPFETWPFSVSSNGASWVAHRRPQWPGRGGHVAAYADIGQARGLRDRSRARPFALHALGAAPAVQKELLRHANIQTTMNIHTQAVMPARREAASKIVDVLWRM